MRRRPARCVGWLMGRGGWHCSTPLIAAFFPSYPAGLQWPCCGHAQPRLRHVRLQLRLPRCAGGNLKGGCALGAHLTRCRRLCCQAPSASTAQGRSARRPSVLPVPPPRLQPATSQQGSSAACSLRGSWGSSSTCVSSAAARQSSRPRPALRALLRAESPAGGPLCSSRRVVRLRLAFRRLVAARCRASGGLLMRLFGAVHGHSGILQTRRTRGCFSMPVVG